MILFIILGFLVGVAVGAALSLHFAGVAELRRKAAEYDRLNPPP